MPASQVANYIVLCARYIMNPTFFHLVFLFTAPLLWFSGNKSARLLVLALIPVLLFSDWWLALFTIGGFTAALLLSAATSFRLSSASDARAIIVYTLLCAAPLFLNLSWKIWPGHILSGENWDPARNGWLYEKYGSAAVELPVEWWWPILACFVIGILLYAYDRFVGIIRGTSDLEDK